jgi:uncharacterized protein (TIGR02246 family)
VNAEQQAIRTVMSDWVDASARGDYAALDPLMHSEVVFLTAGNEPFGKEKFRSAFAAMVQESIFMQNTPFMKLKFTMMWPTHGVFSK